MSSNKTSNPEIALIDGDVLTYRIGFAYENEAESLALWNVDVSIGNIADTLNIRRMEVFLTSTDKSNYRFEISEDYKANRKSPRPKHYEAIRHYLCTQYNAEVVVGREADDAISISHFGSGGKSVICSIDKDFRQLPGWHFHFVRKELDWVSPAEAEYVFWLSVITGDRIDNIRGIKGYGPVKAAKWLEDASSTRDYLGKVRELYRRAFLEEGDLKLAESLNLLRLQRFEDEPLITPEDIEASLSKNLPLYSDYSMLTSNTK